MVSLVSRTAMVLAAVPLVFGITLASAPSATADVLVSSPRAKVCVGRPFSVGVWYQSYSGGPRGYRIDVYAPGGRKVFHVEGKATSGNWQDWRVPTTRVGRYTTVYHGSSHNGPWRYKATTRAVRC